MPSHWVMILPAFLLAGGGVLVFCAGAFWRKGPDNLLFGMALFASASSGLIAMLAPATSGPFPGMIDVGSYSEFFVVLCCLIACVTLLFSKEYAGQRDFSGDEFYGLLLFANLGMVLLSVASNWMVFFLGFEVLSISFYVLVGIHKDNLFSNEAALKYLIMGAVASGFLTFGIAMIFAAGGVMDMAKSLGNGREVTNQHGLLLGLVLILTGIGFKLSLVPLHLWTPDVYQGAPLPVTGFLSTGSKVAVVSALLRIVTHLDSGVWEKMVPIFWLIAALTMVVGNLTALAQNSLKRMLAYSSVAQMGYLIMALLGVREGGSSAIIFYTAIYALMDLGAFGSLAMLSPAKEDVDKLDDCIGLGWLHPWKAVLLSVCLFSLAGFPPTAGFIGKFLLFEATIRAEFVGLAIIGILTAIVSVFFYLRVVVALYMRPAELPPQPMKCGLAPDVATGFLIAAIFTLGVFPGPLLSAISRLVTTMFPS